MGRMTRDMENAALDKNPVGRVLANLYGGRVSQACKAVDHRTALLVAPKGVGGQEDGAAAARQVDRIQGWQQSGEDQVDQPCNW